MKLSPTCSVETSVSLFYLFLISDYSVHICSTLSLPSSLFQLCRDCTYTSENFLYFLHAVLNMKYD